MLTIPQLACAHAQYLFGQTTEVNLTSKVEQYAAVATKYLKSHKNRLSKPTPQSDLCAIGRAQSYSPLPLPNPHRCN